MRIGCRVTGTSRAPSSSDAKIQLFSVYDFVLVKTKDNGRLVVEVLVAE